MTTLPILYKRNTTGSIQQWQIFVENDTYYTEAGQVDGTITISSPTACKSKNSDKANATTGSTQALAEAQSKWKKQIKKGYTENINEVDAALTNFFHPMLAHKFVDHKHKIQYPVNCQTKFDGFRMILSAKGAFSREGNEMVTVPHLIELFKPIIKKYPGIIIDGEAYNHELHDDFQRLCSILKKTKPTIADLFESAENIKYYIYDCPQVDQLTMKDSFQDRNIRLKEVLTEFNLIRHPSIVFVKTDTINSEEEVQIKHDEYAAEGYEGIIIRVNGPYEQKRSKYLLKYKVFDDDEFEIIDIQEGRGNRAGIAARVCCITKDKKTFSAGIIGDVNYCKDLLKNRNTIISKKATVRYFGLSNDDIPRFPKMVIVRDYE